MNQTLYRSKSDRVIFGVAGGMGEYFNIDPIIIRIIFVLLAIWGGIGVLIYLIAALVIPEEPQRRTEDAMAKDEKVTPKKGKIVEVKEEKTIAQDVADGERRKPQSEYKGEKIIGLVIIGLGLIFLAEEFIPGFNFGQLWPLVLIGIGLLILTGSFRRNQ